MIIFNIVFFKILSALLSVLMGFVAGRFSNVDRDSIASLLFYFIAPIVFFSIPTSSNLNFSYLFFTLLTFLLCSSISIFAYFLYGKIWKDSHRNLLALSSGTGNSSYVVLPIATALFDDRTLSIYALGLIGISIYEASIGCYFCARSVTTFTKSVIKVIKLPILNAFFLGCAMSLSGFKLPHFFDEFIYNIKGSFAILGMIIIGLALSQIQQFKFDIKFTLAAFFSKFILYPILFHSVILIDYFIFGVLDQDYYNALRLLCVAPIATNTIVIASLYKIYPDKMATAVLVSLLFVLLYMPLMLTFTLQDIHP